MGLTISTTNGLHSNPNQSLQTKDLMSQNSPDFRQGQENDKSIGSHLMGSTQEIHLQNQEEMIQIQNQMDPYNI